jgi:hypothetical protein
MLPSLGSADNEGPSKREVVVFGAAARAVPGLSSADNAKLANLVAEIRKHGAAGIAARQEEVHHAIAMGRHFVEAKAILLTLKGHGHWTRWLQDNFPHTGRTARSLMRLAGLDPLEVANSKIGLAGLYELTRPGVPDAALEEALTRGAKVDKSKAKAIADKYKVPPIKISTSKAEAAPDADNKQERIDRPTSSAEIINLVSSLLDKIDQKAKRFKHTGISIDIPLLTVDIRYWLVEIASFISKD